MGPVVSRRDHARTAVRPRGELGPTEACRRREKDLSLSVRTYPSRMSIIATVRIQTSHSMLQEAHPTVRIEPGRTPTATTSRIDEDSTYAITSEAGLQRTSPLASMVLYGGARTRATSRLKMRARLGAMVVVAATKVS